MVTDTTQSKYSVENLKNAVVLLLEWLVIYFTPALTMIAVVGVMVVCDLITGVMAALKNGTYGGSRELRKSVPKFIVYAVGIFASNLVQNVYFPNFPVVKLVGGFIIWVEVRSINENIDKTTGLNIIQMILSKIKKILS